MGARGPYGSDPRPCQTATVAANAAEGSQPLMPTLLRRPALNRWTPATPVRVDSGAWIAYLSIDHAAVRAAVGIGRGVTNARVQLVAGVTIEHRDGSTYQLVSRPDG